jgi:hypothetical protein
MRWVEAKNGEWKREDGACLIVPEPQGSYWYLYNSGAYVDRKAPIDFDGVREPPLAWADRTLAERQDH